VGDEAGPFLRHDLHRFAREHGAHIVMTVPSRLPMRPGDAFFEELAAGSAGSCGLEVADVRERMRATFQAAGVDSLYSVAVTLSLDPDRSGVTTIEHFREPGGFWFK
jgi:hypothetical protein